MDDDTAKGSTEWVIYWAPARPELPILKFDGPSEITFLEGSPAIDIERILWEEGAKMHVVSRRPME